MGSPRVRIKSATSPRIRPPEALVEVGNWRGRHVLLLWWGHKGEPGMKSVEGCCRRVRQEAWGCRCKEGWQSGRAGRGREWSQAGMRDLFLKAPYMSQRWMAAASFFPSKFMPSIFLIKKGVLFCFSSCNLDIPRERDSGKSTLSLANSIVQTNKPSEERLDKHFPLKFREAEPFAQCYPTG